MLAPDPHGSLTDKQPRGRAEHVRQVSRQWSGRQGEDWRQVQGPDTGKRGTGRFGSASPRWRRSATYRRERGVSLVLRMPAPPLRARLVGPREEVPRVGENDSVGQERERCRLHLKLLRHSGYRRNYKRWENTVRQEGKQNHYVILPKVTRADKEVTCFPARHSPGVARNRTPALAPSSWTRPMNHGRRSAGRALLQCAVTQGHCAGADVCV